MKKLLLHTLLLSVSVLPAQVVTFTNEYAIWGESHCAHNLRQTIDGGYIFTADAVPEMDTAVNPLAYAYLVKIGAGGATQWIKSFPKSDFFIKPFDANCVCAASDGGYLMATCFYSSQYPASSNNPARILLVKTDAAGNQLWSYIYPGLGLSACYCVNETTDHGFIVCGETADSVTNMQEGYLLKVDSSGMVQWGQCYNTPSPLYGGVLYSALPTADGDYICSGSFDYRMTLFKTDANGNVLWCRITNTPGELFDSRATSDGGYIASGYQTSYSSGSSEAVLMKTNGAGTIQWTDDYYLNTSTSSYDEGYAVVPDGSGYTALISDGYSGGRYLMHTDSAGVPAWAKNYGSVSDLSFSLEKTTDNGFLLNGYSQDYMNVVVVKTDPSGNAACDDSTLVVDHDTVSYIMDSVLTTVSATARNTPAVVFVNHTIVYQTICSANSESGVEDPGGGPPGLAVFPNPAQNSVSVRMDMLHDNSVVISVTDLSGQVVSERKETNVSGTYERTLDLSSLAGGIYFIRVQVDDQPPAVRKVVHE